MAGRLESSARVKAMTREVQKRRANLALSSDLRTGKGNGHGAAVSSLTAVVVEALTIFPASLSDASRAKSPREAFVRLVPNRRESLMFRIADIALMLSYDESNSMHSR